MNLIMLLMKCERFFRNDYRHAPSHGSGAVNMKRRKGRKRTVTDKWYLQKKNALLTVTTAKLKTV